MLSDLVNIEDNDWDSVRRAHGAYTRDLKRIFLSLGLGGDDMGGGVPKSAQDQSIAQDGSYGYPIVTTDMLDELESSFNAALDAAIASIPSVTYPISIANGGTGQTTADTAKASLGLPTVKGFETTVGDTVLYGASAPSFGAYIRLMFLPSPSDPSSSSGATAALQLEKFYSHWYFGNNSGISCPSNVLFKEETLFDNNIRFPAGSSVIEWNYGSPSSTSIDQTSVTTGDVYANSLHPADGATESVIVRNAAGTGTITLNFQEGIFTGSV